MGTRKVYEEKLRSGNLYDHHDPTIKPGLGTPRCPRCLSLPDSHSKTGEWTITPVLHDATAVAGTGLGALLSINYGINTGVPFVYRLVKAPTGSWLSFSIAMSAMFVSTAACAAFGGHALPRFSQLTISSYYAASSASHYGVSLLTRRIEGAHTSSSQQEKF